MATKEQLGELRVFWQDVIDQIRVNMQTMKDRKGRNRYASGNTAQEIDIKNIIDDVEQVLIELVFPQHAIFLDEGVQGWANQADTTGQFSFKRQNPPIPTRAIRSFMMNRGIVPRTESGKRVKLVDPEKQLNAIAYRIRAAIKKNGINRVPFISSVFNEELLNRYKVLLVKIYGDQIKQDIIVGFNSEFAIMEKTF